MKPTLAKDDEHNILASRGFNGFIVTSVLCVKAQK